MGVQERTGLRRIVGVCLGLGVVLGIPSGKAAELEPLPAAAVMPLGGEDDRPTTAWLEFCQRMPAECRVNTTEPEIVPLTRDTWNLLNRVNLKVNETIVQVTDQNHWGVNDRWDYPDDGKGDCEDIQLLKRKLLAEAGLPRRAMRMTVVIDKHDAGHAVLTVRTDRGDLILDNDTDTILPWDRTGYEFVKRESADGMAWVALGGEASRIVVASRSVTSKLEPTAKVTEREK